MGPTYTTTVDLSTSNGSVVVANVSGASSQLTAVSFLSGPKGDTGATGAKGDTGAAGTTDYTLLTNKPTLAAVATSGSYADLTSKPTIPTVPTLVSAFTNDSGYLTGSSLSTYATQSYVTTQINNLVNGASSALDTLGEIATQLASDESAAAALTTAVAGKQATLVSGTNIKTVNGSSLLGSGDVVIAGGVDATTSTKGIVQLAGDLGGTAAAPLAKSRAYSAVVGLTAGDYPVSSYASADVAIQAAITAVSTAGGGTVIVRAGTYSLLAPLVPKSNVLLRGEGDTTILQRGGGGGYAIQGETTTFSGFGLESLKFLGNNATTGITIAVRLTGINDPDATGAGTITGFTMRNVTAQDCQSLPIRLFGLSGRLLVTNCNFDHNADPGFGWNDEVIFTSNRSISSKDNGFSISRGNKKVVCVGNTIENPTFWGIWLSGYASEIGPNQFTITGNVIINARYSGIALIGSPSNGSVTGNYVDQGYNRPTNSNIDGIQIYGDSSTQRAQNITVSGNTIRRASRSGIALANADNISITGNLILDTGTQYLADGTTAISSTDTTTNIGILTTQLNNHNIWVDGNFILDTRATPYCNYDIYKIQSTASGLTLGTNYSKGMLNDRNRIDLINLPVESGSDVGLTVNGPDANINMLLNMQGTGELRVRHNGGGININNVSTAGSGTQSKLRLSAGSTPDGIGQVTATRRDANSSSLIALSPMANGALMANDETAPFYVRGSATANNAYSGFTSGITFKRRAVADVNTTLGTSDYIVAYTSLTAGRTVTLPVASTLAGQTYIVKDEAGTAGTNNLTIVVTTSGTIDGASSKVINVNYGSIVLYSDGTQWRVQAGTYRQLTETDITSLVADLAAKQGTLTLTTTGTSGVATLIGNTLNVPNYAAGTGGTPASTVQSENTILGIAPAVGTSTNYAREDHTHGTTGGFAQFTNTYNDFLGISGTTSQTAPWLPLLVASGTLSASAGSANHPGVLHFVSSTTTNSGGRVQTNTNSLVLGGTEQTDIIFNVPTTSGTTAYLGFHSSASNVTPTDGAYVTISGTTLNASCTNNSTTTNSGTSFTITQSAWYRLNITINSNATSVTFTLYDSTQASVWTQTITTNIPTSRATGHGIVATNSGTTAVGVLDVDFMNLQISRALTR